MSAAPRRKGYLTNFSSTCSYTALAEQLTLPEDCPYQLEDATAFQLKRDSVPATTFGHQRLHLLCTPVSTPTLLCVTNKIRNRNSTGGADHYIL